MLEFLTGPDLYSSVLMLRASETGPLMLLEGSSDARVMSNLVDESCKCIPGYGKDSVLYAMEQAAANMIDGILAIVDSDFDRLEADVVDLPNVFSTEFHDLDLMIYLSPAMDQFLNHWASGVKLATFLDGEGETGMAQVLLERSAPLGALRWYSRSHDLGLSFKEFKLKKYLNRDSLRLDIQAAILALLNRSGQLTNERKEEAAQWVNQTLDADPDLTQLCTGHDVAAVLAIGLKKAIATLSHAEGANVETVERSLRAAYLPDYFETSQLRADLLNWQSSNPDWGLLPTTDTGTAGGEEE